MTDTPTLGRIVLYESATGSGVKYPAIVLRTRATTDPATIERWGPRPDGTIPARPEALVADLPSSLHVDLLVHGLTGDYREFCVPHADHRDVPAGEGSPTARTWTRPPRA